MSTTTTTFTPPPRYQVIDLRVEAPAWEPAVDDAVAIAAARLATQRLAVTAYDEPTLDGGTAWGLTVTGPITDGDLADARAAWTHVLSATDALVAGLVLSYEDIVAVPDAPSSDTYAGPEDFLMYAPLTSSQRRLLAYLVGAGHASIPRCADHLYGASTRTGPVLVVLRGLQARGLVEPRFVGPSRGRPLSPSWQPTAAGYAYVKEALDA